ncbi:hypothetical protein LEP1GSC127_3786 [Leptospira kirschneri str. 200801925]|nr:hypothetical protein LEP1GSC065_1330 [Leptospira kirschneri serovar Sokoine str. RM1]EMO75999.1 hypothetical protein LEP1GSC127_3786 [Leptospira kirschneri str. 200801925]EMO81415.1 hypothetical protein LEP1GSC126_2677 [Leptospira kirschneri str. 200801774]
MLLTGQMVYHKRKLEKAIINKVRYRKSEFMGSYIFRMDL